MEGSLIDFRSWPLIHFQSVDDPLEPFQARLATVPRFGECIDRGDAGQWWVHEVRYIVRRIDQTEREPLYVDGERPGEIYVDIERWEPRR